MRAVNRVLSAVVALALLAGALLLVAEVVVAAVGGDPWIVPYDRWYDEASRTSWDSVAVRLVAAVLVLVGLALLVAELAPRPPRWLPLADRPASPPAAIERRSVEGSVQRAVTGLDGVARARVRGDRRSAYIRVDSSRREPGELESKVRNAAADRLKELGLDEQLRVDIKVSAREGR